MYNKQKEIGKKETLFTSYQSSLVIADTQNRITALMKQKEELAPQLKDYKEVYERLKKEDDELTEKLAQNEQLLEIVSRDLNRIGRDKTFRVVRAESHIDMKDREKKKLAEDEGNGRKTHTVRFTWTDYAVEVLNKEKYFMTTEQLWSRVLVRYDIMQRADEAGLGSKKSGLKWGCIHACWLPNAESTRQGKRGGRLIVTGTHIGLKEWVSNDFKPLPEYIKKIAS